MDQHEDESTLGETVRYVALVIIVGVLSLGLVVMQVLATGVGCWFWAC